MKFINQTEPLIGENEKKAMAEYMESGGWLTEFKKTEQFSRVISEYVGSKHVLMVNNGTIALFLALMALDIKEGDEVIVPDFTMIATANAVVWTGATPVFVDIDPENLCMDFEKMEAAVTPKTKALMLVPINGRFPEMEKFVEFCEQSNLYLIEDAAQALGSRYKGKHLGTFGKVSTLSFSSPKIITTGQGGCVMTDDEALYQRMFKIKDFGRVQTGVDQHDILGYNFKFTDLQAVIGLAQMQTIDWRVKRKRELYSLYKELLRGIPEVEFLATDLESTTPWYMDILVPADKRAALAEFLKEKGIGTRPFYPAIHTQPPYSWVKGDFPNSEMISNRGLWLPSALTLKNEEIEYVSHSIKEFFRRQ